MKLLILFGPPAVGKTTVGKIIEKKTNFKLFHNHMIMDGIMNIFGVGTPTEDLLSREIRSRVIEEAANNNLDLIFTYVWNFNKEKGRNNIDKYKDIYESRGGIVLFIELDAPLEVRIKRGDNKKRLKEKIHAPNGNRVKMLENMLDFNSPDPFYYPKIYKKINIAKVKPEIVADEIIKFIDKF